MRKALTNAVVTSVGRHGKYFWIRLYNHNTTNVLLMHFGMTGMIKLRNVHSHLAFMENGGDKKALEKLERFRYKDSRIKPDVEVKQEWPQGLQSLIWYWKTMTKTRVCIFRSKKISQGSTTLWFGSKH